MKKTRVLIISAILIVALGITAMAAGGLLEIGNTKLLLAGNDLAPESYITAENGAQVPAVVKYVDETGGVTNYLPLRKISEVLGLTVGFDGDTNTAILNPPVQEKDAKSISVPSGAYYAARSESLTSAGELTKKLPLDPANGRYVAITIRNDSNSPVSYTINGDKTMRVPGKELAKRVFELNSLTELSIYMRSEFADGVNVSLSAAQFNPYVEKTENPLVTEWEDLTVGEPVVKNGTLTFTLKNVLPASASDLQYEASYGFSYGAGYSFMRNEGGNWVDVEQDLSFIAIAYNLIPGETKEISIDVSGLPGGYYRLIKPMTDPFGESFRLCLTFVKP